MKRDIDQRTFLFAAQILKLATVLSASSSGKIIAHQIIRSGISIGANVEEAIGAHTKQDFTYKMNIAKSEARETKYWLRLIEEASLVKNDIISSLLREIDELVAILTVIVKNSKIK